MAAQLIFLGAPGSGKGTQAKLLAKSEGYQHISTGDLLRAEIAKESELGEKVEGILKAGQLVDNEIVLELIKSNTNFTEYNYIFDGYPRNLEQAKSLDSSILGDIPKIAVMFDMPIESLVERLTNRRTCKECGEIYNLKTNPPKDGGSCSKCGSTNLLHRDDDKEEVIRDRMKVFSREINPMLSYYESQGSLKRLDASKSSDEVLGALKSLI